MQVETQKIRLWSVQEVKEILDHQNIRFRVERGFDRKGEDMDVPLFVLEKFKID